MRDRHRVFWGVVLIIVGALLLLDSFGEIEIRRVVHVWWPLILVGLGIWVIARRRPARARQPEPSAAAFGDREEVTSDARIAYANVFGDVHVRVNAQAFLGGSVSTVFGDTSVDLSGSVPAEGEQTVRVSGVFGDLRVLVPRGVPVSLRARTLFGSVNTPAGRRQGFGPALTEESPGYAAAPRRLRVDASQVFGDVHVVG